MKKLPLKIIAVLLLINGCSAEKKLAKKDLRNEVPPGCIKVADNFYADATEVSNFAYNEFLFWTRNALGEEAYKKALPDTTVWDEFPCLRHLATQYLRSKKYRDYPVVGVSYEQALAFSKWRSDRVMEFLLIRDGYIKLENLAAKRETFFSVEGYYTGTYKAHKKHPPLKYYPEYRLPTSEEWKLINVKADSINKKRYSWRKTKRCSFDTTINAANEMGICRNDSLMQFPFKHIGCQYARTFEDLRGNADEMSSIKGVALGGSFKNTRSVIMKQDTFHYSNSGITSGFRNVCVWKEWKK